MQTGAGGAYRVFTSYATAARELVLAAGPEVVDKPKLRGVAPQCDAGCLVSADVLTPEQDPFWAATLAAHNTPGETEAQRRLGEFLAGLARGDGYKKGHDLPAADATSRLSAHLRFGEISPAQVWAETTHFADAHPHIASDAWAFLRQLLWRDFAWHRLYHLPDLHTRNVRQQFDAFPWARTAPR